MKFSDIPPDIDLLAALDALERGFPMPPPDYDNVLGTMLPIARAFAARAGIDELEARRVIMTEMFRRARPGR